MTISRIKHVSAVLLGTLLVLVGVLMVIAALIPGEAAHLAQAAGTHCGNGTASGVETRSCSTGEIRISLIVAGTVLAGVGGIVRAVASGR